MKIRPLRAELFHENPSGKSRVVSWKSVRWEPSCFMKIRPVRAEFFHENPSGKSRVVSWKSVRWEPSCFMLTEGRAGRRTDGKTWRSWQLLFAILWTRLKIALQRDREACTIYSTSIDTRRHVLNYADYVSSNGRIVLSGVFVITWNEASPYSIYYNENFMKRFHTFDENLPSRYRDIILTVKCSYALLVASEQYAC